MNLKKAALFLALIVPALPAVTHAAARQSHIVLSPINHRTVGGFLLHVMTVGRKG
jgi:hypothetical protein